ncbi:hypothetical protein [Longibaculum muris]|uniref:hypothetical protein n=1 Tax=Longibaculum muris TaxID=1796628 RepID=UPI0022E3E8C5|nr:hypothetical protein [Longibaculum muris]
MSSHTVSQSTYTNRAKSLTISKHKRKFNYSSQKVVKVRSGISVILNAFCKIFLIIKKVATIQIQYLLNLKQLLLLTFIVLFIGLFAYLSDDSFINSVTEPISKEVVEYRDTITRYEKEYDMEEYVTLI